MFNRNIKNRYHRRDAPYLFVEDKATVLQDQPAQNFVAQYNHVLGRSMVARRADRQHVGRRSRAATSTRSRPSDIALRDVQHHQRFNAAEIQSLNPNYRDPGQRHAQLLPLELRRRQPRPQGRAAAVVGEDGVRAHPQRRHPARDARRRALPGADRRTRRSTRIIVSRPGARSSRIGGRSAAPPSTSACAWTASSATCRRSRARRAPTSASGLFGKTDVYSLLLQHRAASRHLLRPVRQRQDRGEGLLRALLQPVRIGDSRGRQPQRAGDAERRRGPTATAIGSSIRASSAPSRPSPPACSRRWTRLRTGPTATRSTSASSTSSSRTWRSASAIIAASTATASASSTARGRAAAYTPEHADLHRRRRTDEGHHHLQAAARVRHASRPRHHQRRRAARATTTACSSTSRSGCRTAGRCWRVSRCRRHKGFDHSGTFTNPDGTRDFNNPNYLLNRDDGSVFIELPWTFTLSGSYLLPCGHHHLRQVHRPRRGSAGSRERVLVHRRRRRRSRARPSGWQQRGEDRTETVSKFLDVRFAKRFQVSRRSNLEGTVDLFNLLNANHVLGQITTLGPTWGRPEPDPHAAHRPLRHHRALLVRCCIRAGMRIASASARCPGMARARSCHHSRCSTSSTLDPDRHYALQCPEAPLRAFGGVHVALPCRRTDEYDEDPRRLVLRRFAC